MTMKKKTDGGSAPGGVPVKPKKPLPTKEEPAKVPVSVLTEERVREIAREEISRHAAGQAAFRIALAQQDIDQ